MTRSSSRPSPPAHSTLRNFEELARSLQWCTDEITISIAQIYKKTRQNMDWAAREFGFKWEDPADGLKQSLVSDLAACAQSFGMTLTVCSQEKFVGGAVGEARCIDTARLFAVAGAPVRAPQKGNRPECACFEARDIGEYDTCPHGCVYCYAVRNRPLAQRRYVPARSRRPVSLSAAQSARQRIQP